MGLQNPDPRFKSGCRLQDFKLVYELMCAGVAELVDAKDLKSFGLTPVPVRVRPSAPKYFTNVKLDKSYSSKYCTIVTSLFA